MCLDAQPNQLFNQDFWLLTLVLLVLARHEIGLAGRSSDATLDSCLVLPPKLELLLLPLLLVEYVRALHGPLLRQLYHSLNYIRTPSLSHKSLHLATSNIMVINFLDLPRELRDEIYTYYVVQDGGYLYDQRTRRLRTTSGGPIDVALMQTCSQVAHELRPLLFRTNTVTFRTGWINRETSDRAAAFASALKFIYLASAYQLFRVRTSITDDMIQRAGIEFPQCLPLLRHIRGPSGWGAPTHVQIVQDWKVWHHPPSTHRVFIKFMLSLTKGTKKWWKFWKDDQTLGEKHGRSDIVSLLARIPNPWIIPDEYDIASLKEQCFLWSSMISSPPPSDRSGPIKRYFSAAALAIHFLNGLSSNVLSSIRHVVLDEVHTSVAYPECHVLGLASMMQQHPRISISRQVDTRITAITGKLGHPYFEDLIGFYQSGRSWDRYGKIERIYVSQAFVRWFEEAVAVSSKIPPDRFSLIFHSKNTESTLAILEQMLEDAKWQNTVEALDTQPTSPLGPVNSVCFFSKSFSRVMREIQRGEGNICFDIGNLQLSNSSTQISVDQHSTPYALGSDWIRTFQLTYVEPSPYSGWEDMLQDYMEDEAQHE